jgi:TM2 domain-containing membrane protein YozV/cold shock CspA family protein
MKGTVLHFSIQENKGFIAGDDGNRYEFMGKSWGLLQSPAQGIKVDFGIEYDQAIKIFADPNAVSIPAKSRTLSSLLAFFLGVFGIQFFYLDLWGWGILSILFCWTYIPFLVGIVLGIQWHLMSDKEFHRKIKNISGSLKDIQQLFSTKLDRKSTIGFLVLVAIVLISVQANKQSLSKELVNRCKVDNQTSTVGDFSYRLCSEAWDKYESAPGIRL